MIGGEEKCPRECLYKIIFSWRRVFQFFFLEKGKLEIFFLKKAFPFSAESPLMIWGAEKISEINLCFPRGSLLQILGLGDIFSWRRAFEFFFSIFSGPPLDHPLKVTSQEKIILMSYLNFHFSPGMHPDSYSRHNDSSFDKENICGFGLYLRIMVGFVFGFGFASCVYLNTTDHLKVHYKASTFMHEFLKKCYWVVHWKGSCSPEASSDLMDN